MIPILDLAEGAELDRCKDLVSYLSTVGFVYLRNHGIPDSQIRSCRQAADRFFARDSNFKQSLVSDDAYKYVGYKGFETERLNPKRREKDMRESILYDWHDICSNSWPDKESQCQIAPLMENMGRLANRVLSMIGVGLELDDPEIIRKVHTAFDDVRSAQSKSLTTFRINRYPKLSPGDLKPDQVLCGEHADYGTITFLIQDHVPGLEVQKTDGTFIDATPIQGTILFNIGLMLEMMTNAKLRATRHRIVRATEEQRISMAFFVLPDEDVLVQPLPELLREGDQVGYEPCHPGQFFHMMFSKIN